MAITSDIHDLIITPKNTSLVLSAAHHLLYRPVNAVMGAAGHKLPSLADPARWGAELNKAGEKVDFALSPGTTRKEMVTLDSNHLIGIGEHLDHIHSKSPSDGKLLEEHLNSLVRDHYNNEENIQSLVSKAKADPKFAATLHGVMVPSLTGEVGRSIKHVATDVAALYGSAELMDLAQSHSEKKGTSMSNLERAQDLIAKAASILESLPVRDMAHEKAAKLLDEGVITSDEVEKIASVFERNPAEADAIAAGMTRGGGSSFKSANLGEPFFEESTTKHKGIDRFTQACLDGVR